MAIIYTKHAREMLVFRKIGKDKVESCIKNPDDVSAAKEGKEAYLKNFGKNYLKIIVSKEGPSLVVITLHWLAKRRVKK